MNWVTVIWSMTAAACLTLAAIHFLVWWQRRTVWADLVFSLTSVGVAAFAGCELSMMLAQTPEQFAAALRWLQVPTWVIVLSLVGFVRLHFRAGRPWLAWSVFALRTLALLLNFLVGQNLNYSEVTALRRIPFLGETVSLGVGVSNPWMLVGQLSLLALVMFTLDATITVWRRGGRRQAMVTGGSIVFFTMTGMAQAVLVLWRIVDLPLTVSFSFLGTVVAMGYEMSRETLRAAKLSDELRESEARMTMAAEAAAFGVWIWTTANDRVWASERALRLFGFERGADVSYEMIFQRIHPDDREKVETALRHAMETGASYASEYRVNLPDGTVRWIEAQGRTHPNGDEKASRMLGAVIDITERKQAEQDLAQHRSEVAHLSRVTTLGEISGSLAHELGQPLGAILANTDSIEMHLQSPAPNLDEVRAILADIRRDDMRASEIIHGIRAFLRRQELDMQPIEVRHMAEETVKLLSSDAAARKTTVGIEIPQGLPPVRGDRIHLQQVLLNLLVNGMDAMNTCPVADRRITIRATQPDLHIVEIAVSDSGVGIPPGELDRLFTPFHTTKQSGLGLGLPICRSIVEAHGGSISLQNNPQRGTTARFTLPAWREGRT
jgi:PAS domain S-box-containing protein